MNTVDIIVIVILLFALIKGLSSGIIVQLAGIAGILAGIWVASYFSKWIADLVGMNNANEKVMYVFTVIVVMVGVILLLKALDKILKSAGLSTPIRILGAIFSLGKWILVLTLALSVYKSIATSWHFGMSDSVKNSIFYEPLITIEKNIFPFFTELGDIKPGAVKHDNLNTI